MSGQRQRHAASKRAAGDVSGAAVHSGENGRPAAQRPIFLPAALPDYMEENEVDWDIVYDDRGHFIEPHTERSIGLGTISVRDYLKSIANRNLTSPGSPRALL